MGSPQRDGKFLLYSPLMAIGPQEKMICSQMLPHGTPWLLSTPCKALCCSLGMNCICIKIRQAHGCLCLPSIEAQSFFDSHTCDVTTILPHLGLWHWHWQHQSEQLYHCWWSPWSGLAGSWHWAAEWHWRAQSWRELQAGMPEMKPVGLKEKEGSSMKPSEEWLNLEFYWF